MLALHVAICFLALLAGAVVLIAFCGGRRPPTGSPTVLILSTALISVTGLALPSPPGTPTPDPARILSYIELVVVAFAALALYVNHLARAWRAIYVLAMVLAVYFNVFVTITQAFLKIEFLHALAPSGKEPPFLIAQLLALGLFVVIGILAFRRLPARTASVPA